VSYHFPEHDLDEIRQLIVDCYKRSHKLNPWEQGFINGFANKKLSQLSNLTEKQISIIESIWEKATS